MGRTAAVGYKYTFQGGRPYNEDTCGLFSNGENYTAIVADGLGGHGGGKQASEIAVRYLSACGANGNLPEAAEIEACMRAINEEIYKRRENKNHMKTTAVYLCIHGDTAMWAHIGDSRLYHFVNGRLCDYTLDHSVSQVAVAMGEITRDQIPGHPDRSRVLRVLGDDELQPEIHEPVRLARGRHAFLLCTDGFWESVREDEMQLDLYKSNSPGEWVDAMCHRLLLRMDEKHDNNTAVAVFADC